MLVFRVAHSVCKRDIRDYYAGPYTRFTTPALPEGTTKNLTNRMGYSHTDSAHSAPHLDPELGGIAPYEVCGMVSRRSLNTWFHGWRGLLKRYGYQVYVFKVPKQFVRVGRNGQCVFEIAAATLIRTEEITA